MITSRPSGGRGVPGTVKRARLFMSCRAFLLCLTGTFMLVLAPEARDGESGTLALIGASALLLGGFLAYGVYRLGRPIPAALRGVLVAIEVLYLAGGVVLLFVMPAGGDPLVPVGGVGRGEVEAVHQDVARGRLVQP
ncbi:hypothetical protein AB0M64_31575, partial [Streptomyces sp. NPDC051771]|uniref:hypothetical protein n=1 Tax=Streptomyces sp. NPDC051771 TaxID=3154847 RepID=UPI003428BC15